MIAVGLAPLHDAVAPADALLASRICKRTEFQPAPEVPVDGPPGRIAQGRHVTHLDPGPQALPVLHDAEIVIEPVLSLLVDVYRQHRLSLLEPGVATQCLDADTMFLWQGLTAQGLEQIQCAVRLAFPEPQRRRAGTP